MVAAGLGVIYLFPLLTKAIPSPLVAIVVLTAVAIGMGLDIRIVGDMGPFRTVCQCSCSRKSR